MDLENIYDIIKQRIKQSGTLNVMIAGATCSGKSTLANQLVSDFSKDVAVVLIRQDDYFKDLSDIPKVAQGYLMDSVNAFHTHEFKQDIEQLLTTGRVLIPRYNVSKNRRIAKDAQIDSGVLNIFEGLHTISLLRNIENSISVFLNTPLELCLERRIKRDMDLYNVPESRIRENFNECILPMYRSYIAPQLNIADITIKGME